MGAVVTVGHSWIQDLIINLVTICPRVWDKEYEWEHLQCQLWAREPIAA